MVGLARGNSKQQGFMRKQRLRTAAKVVMIANALSDNSDNSPKSNKDDRMYLSNKSGEKTSNQSRQRRMSSGILSLFTHEGNHDSDEFDAGVNSMAVLCALVLAVPYFVLNGINYGNLDRMRELFADCDSDELTYDDVYFVYRGSFIATVYWAIAGMILATFYFVFKRTQEEEYELWRWKAQYLVISMFVCTAFAISALILLTNMVFSYFLLAAGKPPDGIDPGDYFHHDICDNGSYPYISPGIALTSLSFVWSIYLVW